MCSKFINLSFQVRVVLLAAAAVDQLFVTSGGEGERDRQLLDDLGLSGVKCALAATLQDWLNVLGTLQNKTHIDVLVSMLNVLTYMNSSNLQ